MSDPRFSIDKAHSIAEIDEVRTLFREYEQSLNIDLCFQGFEDELATLPGNYSPPAGELLLARDPDGAPLGCIALRPTEIDGVCEMKRLYVRPTGRGRGLGRALVEAIEAEATASGYHEMRLDTLPSMERAIALYRSLGFEPIAAYYQTPVEHTVFLAKSLK